MKKKLNLSKLDKAAGGFGFADIKAGASKAYSKVKSAAETVSIKLGPIASSAFKRSIQGAVAFGLASKAVGGDNDQVLGSMGSGLAVGLSGGAIEGTVRKFKK